MTVSASKRRESPFVGEKVLGTPVPAPLHCCGAAARDVSRRLRRVASRPDRCRCVKPQAGSAAVQGIRPHVAHAADVEFATFARRRGRTLGRATLRRGCVDAHGDGRFRRWAIDSYFLRNRQVKPATPAEQTARRSFRAKFRARAMRVRSCPPEIERSGALSRHRRRKMKRSSMKVPCGRGLRRICGADRRLGTSRG